MVESHGAVCGFGVGGGAAADRHATLMRASQVVGGDACSNHHLRAAKHPVLDTLLWEYKLIITLGGRGESVMERCEGSEGAGARQRTGTPPQCAHQVVGGDACSNHHFRAANHCVLARFVYLNAFGAI